MNIIRQLARAHPAALQVYRVALLHERARAHFPGNELHQERWVQARLRLRQIGCRRPRVRIGCAINTTGDLS